MMKRLPLCLLMLAACGEPGDDAPGSPDGSAAADITLDVAVDGPDAGGADAGWTEDATAGEVPDTSAPDATDVGAPDDTSAPDVADASTPPSALLFDAAWLDEVLLYGISSDPDSPLSAIGQSAAGIAPLLVRVVVEGEVCAIRVADGAGAPMPGPDALVESYPCEAVEGGAAPSFAKPVATVEIQLTKSCTYAVTATLVAGEPAIGDGLLTWPLLETFTPKGCQGYGLPPSLGVNVHWLRRLDANPSFAARAVDPTVPYGFFQVGSDEAPLITRLPIEADTTDGSIVYYTSAAFPPHLLSTMVAVLEAWNDTLEEVAGVRPFAHQVAEDWLIPWDPRYRFIAWDPSKTQGAVAPFDADPLTGEMFATRVLLWMGDMEQLVAKYVAYLEKYPDAPWIGSGAPAPTGLALPAGGDLPPRVLRRQVWPARPFGLREVREAWLATGRSLPPDELAREILAQFLVHELGHNLGLRHNFKGSLDKEHHPEDAPSTTVMDYVVGLGRPGAYDRDAMRFGYGVADAGPPYLYCTDEDVPIDPGCARWDAGHPVAWVLGALDAIAAQIDPGASAASLNTKAEEQQWGELFTRARQFVNTDYEAWDPGAPLPMVDELLGRVLCEPGCETHPWLRSQLALYLLYTKHAVQTWDGDVQWHDFPPLDEAQAASVLGGLYTVVTTPEEPLSLKLAIIAKLPTANVPGASELLDALAEHFATLGEPTEEDGIVLAAIAKAKG